MWITKAVLGKRSWNQGSVRKLRLRILSGSLATGFGQNFTRWTWAMWGDKAMTSLQPCPPKPTLTRIKTKAKHGDIKVCILKQNNSSKHSKSQPSFCFSVILLVPRWMLLTLQPQLFPVWMGILLSSSFLSPFSAPLSECRWDLLFFPSEKWRQ